MINKAFEQLGSDIFDSLYHAVICSSKFCFSVKYDGQIVG